MNNLIPPPCVGVLALLLVGMAPASQPFFLPNHDPKPAGQKWLLVENMSDEFDGPALDHTKWQDEPVGNGWNWYGRAPGLFRAENVQLKEGKLCVTVSKLAAPVVRGGKTFTHQGAIVRSLHPGQPGWYFECRMKANATIMSSTFWLMAKDDPKKRLELDIQECVGLTTDKTAPWGKNWDRIFHSNLIQHKNRFTPDKVQLQKSVPTETKNWERYYVYGAWWKSPEEVQFYLDGKYVYSIKPKVAWNVPAFIQMAIETYDWNPIPDDGGLVETGTWEQRTTQYDWVRIWKLADQAIAPTEASPAEESSAVRGENADMLSGLAVSDPITRYEKPAINGPNVILIVTDDQGYGDMSCHGNPWIHTPNLDRLHAESVRLEDYHVDPVCTPTRASLMTGRYSSRVGAWTVTQGRQLLRLGEVTMADVFSDSGYRTGMFGKWHLGDPWPHAPRFRGFHEVVRHLAGGIDEIGNPIGNDFFDDTYFRNGLPEKIDGYCTDVFFAECQRFITQKSGTPFFAYLALNAMHSPHTVAEKYSTPFRAAGHGEQRSKFYGQIINFDENLGRLLDCLETHDLAENTIVIFMGDNGTAAGAGNGKPNDGFNAGMRGKKGSVFEGGHRVACFVRWPSRLKAGHEVRQLTSCRDWLPTLIELCNLDVPKDVNFDGQSLLPLMTGCVGGWPDRTLFVERHGDHPTLDESEGRRARSPTFAVLTERWRLVDVALFDIVDDPGQHGNVASEHANIVRDLRARYEKHFADVFSDNGAYTRFQLGSRQENPTRLTVRDWHPTEGNVIWKQEQLGDDTLAVNGFWAVNIVRAGRYSIRLSRFPDDATHPMGATKAVLRIGEQESERKLAGNESSVTFELDLPQGHELLQSWLSDENGVVRGAYFVRVARLNEQN